MYERTPLTSPWMTFGSLEWRNARASATSVSCAIQDFIGQLISDFELKAALTNCRRLAFGCELKYAVMWLLSCHGLTM